MSKTLPDFLLYKLQFLNTFFFAEKEDKLARVWASQVFASKAALNYITHKFQLTKHPFPARPILSTNSSGATMTRKCCIILSAILGELVNIQTVNLPKIFYVYVDFFVIRLFRGLSALAPGTFPERNNPERKNPELDHKFA